MNNKTELCLELLELTRKQEDIIKNQNKLIAELTNENLEKENIINILSQDIVP